MTRGNSRARNIGNKPLVLQADGEDAVFISTDGAQRAATEYTARTRCRTAVKPKHDRGAILGYVVLIY